MKYCMRCGQILDDSYNFCFKCGLKQPLLNYENIQKKDEIIPEPEIIQTEQENQNSLPINEDNQNRLQNGKQPVTQSQYEIPPNFQPGIYIENLKTDKIRNPNILYFIWSIVLIFIVNPVGTPLAIISTVFASIANSQTESSEKAQRNLLISKVLCIFITVVDVLCILGLIVLFIYSIKTNGINSEVFPYSGSPS